jgi:hypothetical protein
MATTALACGGRMFPPTADPITRRLNFSFYSRSLVNDFESRVLDGTVTVNARELLAANNVIPGMIQRHKRALRQEGA